MSFRELVVEMAIDLDNNSQYVFATSSPSLRNIYVGEMNQDTQKAIMLIAVPSPPPHQYIDTEYQVIDFWARAPHTDEAMAMLRDVYNLYHRRYGFTTNNWYVYFSQALGNIIDVDRDAQSGKLFRLSVQFLCRNLTNVS